MIGRVLAWALLLGLAAQPALAHHMLGGRISVRTTGGKLIEGSLVDTLPDGYLIKLPTGRTVKVHFDRVQEVKRRAPAPVTLPATSPSPARGSRRWRLTARNQTVQESDHRSSRTFASKFLAIREGEVRDVPAREVIESSGDPELLESYQRVHDDVGGGKIWAHLGYGTLEAIGIAATVVGISLLTKGNLNTDDEKARYWGIGGFVTLIGVAVTIDTPFRWSRRIREINAQLTDVATTPNLDWFMSPERARQEVERHNKGLGLSP